MAITLDIKYRRQIANHNSNFGGSGGKPQDIFEILDLKWCNLMHFSPQFRPTEEGVWGHATEENFESLDLKWCIPMHFSTQYIMA